MISEGLCFAARFRWKEEISSLFQMYFKLLDSVVKILKLTDKNVGHQDSKTDSFTLSFTLFHTFFY